MTDGDCVDTLVNTPNTFFPVDVPESCPGRLRSNSSCKLLVLCDLHGLHARAEAHCRVGLCKTSDHTTTDAGHEIASAEGLRIVLGFGCNEEQDSALCGGFDPGPGNEALVDYTTCNVLAEVSLLILFRDDMGSFLRRTAKDTTTPPYPRDGIAEAV